MKTAVGHFKKATHVYTLFRHKGFFTLVQEFGLFKVANGNDVALMEEKKLYQSNVFLGLLNI